MTLVEFLLARIADDDAAARGITGEHDRWQSYVMDDIAGCSVYDDQWLLATVAWYDHNKPMSADLNATGPGYIDSDRVAAHIARHDPARVLAECEAKRRIIGEFQADPAFDDGYERVSGLHDAIRLLAVVYADHPDYRDEWRP